MWVVWGRGKTCGIASIQLCLWICRCSSNSCCYERVELHLHGSVEIMWFFTFLVSSQHQYLVPCSSVALLQLLVFCERWSWCPGLCMTPWPATMILLSSPPSLALMGGILSPEMMGAAWPSTGLGKSQRGRSHTACITVFLQKCVKQQNWNKRVLWMHFDLTDSAPVGGVSNHNCCFPISVIISHW